MSDNTEVSVCSGKYTFVLDGTGDYLTEIRRWGEPWSIKVDGAGCNIKYGRGIGALAAELNDARKMLREAADLFRFYETSHRAKGSPSGDSKAERNAEIAARIEAMLGDDVRQDTSINLRHRLLVDAASRFEDACHVNETMMDACVEDAESNCIATELRKSAEVIHQNVKELLA